jgi:xanthine dehydrogenase accessory protein XdhC
MFEPVSSSSDWITRAAQLQACGQDWVRVVATKADETSEGSAHLMFTADTLDLELNDAVDARELLKAAKSMLLGSQKTTLQQAGGSQDFFFFDVSRKPDFQLVLFGAGHVGRALVNVLRDMPIQIRWVDGRDNQFPVEVLDNVECVSSDIPEAEVDAAPSGVFFLVMTHDHALDQCLAEQILKRDDFAYFGLIGSTSKRRMFETRMHRRGIAKNKFEYMKCPIGVDGIRSKSPSAIAISVAAELMQVYDRNLDLKNDNSKAYKRSVTEG